MSSNAIASNLPIAEVSLDSVLISSSCTDHDSNKQLQNIIQLFNARSVSTFGSLEATIVKSVLRGERIPPTDLLFFSRNQIPVVALDQGDLVAPALNFMPGVKITRERAFPKTAKSISLLGSHIVSVPQGFFGRCTRGTSATAFLLDEGAHVFHDATFELAAGPFVEKSEGYIHTGSVHVLRVAPGFVARVRLGPQCFLLESRKEPYVFNSPLFKVDADPFVSQNEALISHGTQHRVRVPRGKLALVWVNNQPLILASQASAYIFDTPYFSNSKTASGQIVRDTSWLVNANDKLIIHGSIKRITPVTGEVCVCSKAGNLVIINPSPNNEPYVTDDETFTVDDFLPTNIQTLLFPSIETQNERRRENKKATDEEVAYTIFSTRDSLKIGIKILLTFTIDQPEKTLRALKRSEILRHIENLSIADVGKAMQQSSSSQFLSFAHTQAQPTVNNSSDILNGLSADAAPLLHFVDLVKNALARDLLQIGIKLERLNIETPKVIDQDISKSMEQQSLITAQSNSQEALLDQQYKIARVKAEQEAQVSAIAQTQKNANIVSAAQAELSAAQLRAEALFVAEQGLQKAAELRGKQFQNQPVLLQLELARLQAEAIRSANVNLMVGELNGSGLAGLLLPGLAFNKQQPTAAARST